MATACPITVSNQRELRFVGRRWREALQERTKPGFSGRMRPTGTNRKSPSTLSFETPTERLGRFTKSPLRCDEPSNVVAGALSAACSVSDLSHKKESFVLLADHQRECIRVEIHSGCTGQWAR